MNERQRQQENKVVFKTLVALMHHVSEHIVEVRSQRVIIDAVVAALYGVPTRRINEAVKNNPDKFPPSYMFRLKAEELVDLRSKITTTNLSPKSRTLPAAFTEKGLYMLATILKSTTATNTIDK